MRAFDRQHIALAGSNLERTVAYKQPCVRTGLLEIIGIVNVPIDATFPHNVGAGLGVEDLDIGPNLIPNVTIVVLIRIVNDDPDLISFLNIRYPKLPVLVHGEVHLRIGRESSQGKESHKQDRYDASYG